MIRFSPEGVLVPQLVDPGYEAIWGVAGTERKPSLRRHTGKVFFWSPANGNDNNYGLSPLEPFATLTALLARTWEPRLESFDTIWLLDDATESVVTNDYVTGPNHVQVLGAGFGRYSPSWQSAGAAAIALDLRAIGWRIAGIRFLGQATAACIELRHTDTGANDIAIRTIIEACYFDGLTTGLTGIASHGCYDVVVKGCTFQLWHNIGGTAACMRVGTTPLAIPYRNYIEDNLFGDSDNGVIWPSNGSYFRGNEFQPVGYAYPMTQVLNTSIIANPGDDNMVTRNIMAADYSIVGGYSPGAADVWIANFAEDLAEAEVGDNGLTIARPV